MTSSKLTALTVVNLMLLRRFVRCRDTINTRTNVTPQEIRTFFRNWKNNTYKKSLPTAAASSTSIGAASSPATQRALNDAIRGLVVLEGDLSPKDLFFREQPQEYSRAYQEIKATVPTGTHACVISQKAKKRAWDHADQEYWGQRKRKLELDVVRCVYAP